MKLVVDRKKRETITEVIFYVLVFAAITCFAMIQTFGDPPDEINRFKVVNYICNHGRLPQGADPEVIIAGYGASYAFQPMLTYIIQGFLLRFLKLFTADSYILLLAARMVNVIFGVAMAYYVRESSKEAWKNPFIQWAFTLLVVFLPQNIFLHSYVNTDSMAMLSVAMIFYALLRGQRTDFERRDCITLAVGIILCAMSYYNAYGIILAAILIFAFHYVHYVHGLENGESRKKRIIVDWKMMFKKGIFISVIVLLGCGWWFIRNAVLYGGDIFAMAARRECAIETASADYNPLTYLTYQNSGATLREMLFTTGYITLMRDSFIAMFGPMLIPTHGLIYIYYKRLWIVTGIAALIPAEWIKGVKKEMGFHDGLAEWGTERNVSKSERLLFLGGMLLFTVITIGLAIYYSYTWDFQPQGRYILPVLMPLMYLVAAGMRKICIFLDSSRGMLLGRWLGRAFCLGIMTFVMLAFTYSLFRRFIPHYMSMENMFQMYGKPFLP